MCIRACVIFHAINYVKYGVPADIVFQGNAVLSIICERIPSNIM